jgi:hypothetical protein
MKKTLKNHLTIVLAALFLAFSGCTFIQEKTIKGDGEIISETFVVEEFSELIVGGAFSVSLIKGDDAKVVIEVDKNLLEYISVNSKGNKLVIDKNRKVALNPTRMRVQVTYSGLEKIDLSGACNLVGNETIEGDIFELSVSGAASVDLDFLVRELHLSLSGAGNIKLEGETEKFFCELSGASSLRAKNLVSQSTEISLSGAGSAEVHATGSLKASLSGLGSITYHGDPPNTNINKSGLGSIKRAN